MLAKRYQGKFAPSEHPKTRVIEEEMKEKEEVSPLMSRLAGRTGEAGDGEGGGGNASLAGQFQSRDP